MQMSYGTSIKVESIVDLEKTLSLPQIWKLSSLSVLAKAKTRKKENVTLKGKTMWISVLQKESSITCVNCPVSK